ncbi:MAG: HDOD domain-containing protein, partial [Candidatus Hydrogenedentes bacterium]|nr:HDOD domain-containing protein [Candidatus Hydrogenedentota bacterium]
LTLVMERYPETIRMVLSGHADNETMFRAAGISHQYITKPCEAQTLKNLLERAFALRYLLNNPRLNRLLSRLQALPSLPELYMRVLRELREPDPSIRSIAEIIEQDFGMCTKLLHFVNSAYFGLSQRISSPLQAINYIGLSNLRSLILSLDAFSQTEQRRLPPSFSMDRLWQHSLVVAAYARVIARTERVAEGIMDDTYTAGLLHDVGILVLASNLPDIYGLVLDRLAKGNKRLDELELAMLGATHGEVGAYLLALWGLPDNVVEAVAFHHHPSQSLSDSLAPVTFVHAADCFHSRSVEAGHGEGSTLDVPYLQRLMLEDRLPTWLDACQHMPAVFANTGS